MKNQITVKKLLGRSALALVMAVAVGLPLQSAAQDKGSAKGGASQLLLKPVKTVEDLQKLETGDAVVMSCPKCKSTTVNYVTTEKGHIQTTATGEKHLCPGCQTTIETTGHGKAKKDEVKHVCQKCGSKDVMCCVLKKGSGPSKGMEDEKK